VLVRVKWEDSLTNDVMPEQLPDHSHCVICDAAVPQDQKFCSETCESEFNQAAKKSRRRNNIFIIIVIVLAIFVGSLSLFL
jgi:predicted nucleic acid-binding Zn ribbon protein